VNLWFVLGTAAELIKIYSLIDEAERQQMSWRILLTGQSANNFRMQAQDFNIPNSQIIELNPAQGDLKNSLMALRWFFKAMLIRKATIRAKIKENTAPEITKKDFLFVHGDTLSTLIGTIYGKRLGLKIVHIEAGMRSHCWWAPFPEELSRRLVSRLAEFHMAPDENAANNLKNENITKNVTITGGNTVVDALQLALKNSKAPTRHYVIANVHRFENLHSESRWGQIVDLIIDVAKTQNVIFVLMPTTIELLEKDTVSKQRLIAAGVELKHRMPFKQFTELLHESLFVLSDGGSNQQECHYVGKPCLVLREITESIEGIGASCVLAKFNPEIIQDFLANYKTYMRPTAFPVKRPTDIIFESLFHE